MPIDPQKLPLEIITTLQRQRRSQRSTQFLQFLQDTRGYLARRKLASFRTFGPAGACTLGPNWVRFAHFPSVLPARNWLCLARQAIDWNGGIMEYWNDGVHRESGVQARRLTLLQLASFRILRPPGTWPACRFGQIGFVSHDRPRRAGGQGPGVGCQFADP